MVEASVAGITKTAARVARVGRRQEWSASTRRTLVDVAERLFTEHGYAATSLDAVVAGAEVTKGAFYHHFSGKLAIFEEVFRRHQEQAVAEVRSALRDDDDPWTRARTALRAFLDVVQRPTYRRVVLLDGPAVLGQERFRDREEHNTLSVVADVVRPALAAGGWDVEPEMVMTFTRVFLGAVSAAGQSVTLAGDPAAEAARVEAAIGAVIAGFQSLATAGR